MGQGLVGETLLRATAERLRAGERAVLFGVEEGAQLASAIEELLSTLPGRDPADPRVAEQVSPWSPVTDKLELARVLKLVEEAGELVSIAARTLMQGADGADPKTGKINRDALADELADVAGATRHVSEHYGMDPAVLSVRAERKYSLKTIWHGMIRRGEC